MLPPRSLLMMLLAAGLPGNKLGKSLPNAFAELWVCHNFQGPQAVLVALMQVAGVKPIYVLIRGVGKYQYPLWSGAILGMDL